MARRRWFALVTLIGGLTPAAISPLWAQPLRPFDAVQDVCPRCPTTGYDRITLVGGLEMEAVVLAENQSFYVLEKYGELRTLDREKVERIDRASPAAAGPGYEDQVLLKNGIVLAGRIVQEYPLTGYLELQVPNVASHTFLAKPALRAVYRAGVQSYTAPQLAGSR